MKKARQTNKQKHSRTSPNLQFKLVSLTKQKTKQEWTMDGLEHHFEKKSEEQ